MVVRVAPLVDPDQGVNPYLRLLYAAQSSDALELVSCPGVRFRWLWHNARSIDVLHLHWPAYYYSSPSRYQRWKRLVIVTAFLALARLLGVCVVWTMHNVLPHRRYPGWIDRAARLLLFAVVTHVIVHDEQALAEARRAFHVGLSASVVPHMSYLGAYGPAVERRAARRGLGLPDEAFVYLVFGSIRPNKNLTEIVEAFREVRRCEDMLLVAGVPESAEIEAASCETAANDPCIRLDLEEISDDRLPMYLSAADVAVSASRITTSGTLFLNLTYGLPVIAPEETIPSDLRGLPCCIPYGETHPGLHEAMQQGRQIDLAAARSAALQVAWQRHPDRVSQRLVEVFRRLLALRTPRRINA